MRANLVRAAARIPGLKAIRRATRRALTGAAEPVDGGPRDNDKAVYRKAESLGEFWDLAHSTDRSWWTSGTPFEYIQAAFSLPPDLSGAKALVIGVGQGQELYGFRAAGAAASGLDVSQAARDRFSNEFPMYTQDTLAGKFDVIVMHLVAQHMSNAQLASLLASLSPHLDESGALHVQFACPIHAGQALDPGDTEDLSVLKGGSRAREILEVIALIGRDFSITDLRVIGVFPAFGAYHLAATLRRPA